MSWLRRLTGAGKPAEQPVGEASAEALLREGYDCERRGDAAGAERAYRGILERDAQDAEAAFFLGRVAAWDRRYEEAIELLRSAAGHEPAEMTYQWALGAILLEAGRYAEATPALRACVALQPGCADARLNLAVSLIEQGQREEARLELERLQGIESVAWRVDFNLAGIYREYGRVDEAIAAYRRALQREPRHAETWDNLLLTLNYTASIDGAALLAEHQRYGELFALPYATPSADAAWPRRLRIGYVSPDFRGHVVSYFIEPVLERADRGRFEVFCYHTNRRKDATTERLRRLVEHWRDCEDLADAALAQRIREDRIDILVDLAGHTAGNRLSVFATKPAPVQATYLGYPMRTGLAAIDYHITDPYSEPAGAADASPTERPMRLPVTYYCYRPAPNVPEPGPLAAAQAGTVTFGSFSNYVKVSDAYLAAVVRILKEVPSSRFLVKARPLSIPGVAQALRERFERAGIDPARLDLRGWAPGLAGHLETYRAVDVALDSFPYNGGTTSCEAMWMGVPVVSLSGDRSCWRMGSGILHAAGMGELVARDVDQYVALAAGLAADLPRLAGLRATLRERMASSPLRDETGFTRALEACYLRMWEERGSTARSATSESAAALVARARALRKEGKLSDAQSQCAAVLQREPTHLEALALLWDIGFDAGAPGASLDWLQRAIAADTGVAVFHHMLGSVLQAQGNLPAAIEAYQRALQLDPLRAKTHNNLGCLLEAAGQAQGAMQCYLEAVRLDSRLADATYNLGNLQKQAGDFEHAAANMRNAIVLEPRRAEWLCNLGGLQHDRLQLDEAIGSFRAAIQADPRHAPAHAQLASVLLMTGMHDEAIAALERAHALGPDPAIESWLLLARHYGAAQDAADLFARHRAWAQRHADGVLRASVHPARRRTSPRRLNVGYVSPDFMRHPVAGFIEPVIGAHDRDRFEVFCYSSASSDDAVTRRLRSLADHWRDIAGLPDDHVADRIRADGIDILVDLAGHTGGSRLLVLAHKPAPVQATWIGYPDTSGMAAMDYRITDAIADPPGSTEHLHTEKLVRLPGGFLCYNAPADAPHPAPRATGPITFGSFNGLAKLTPQMVELWAKLLGAVPGSRLLVKTYGLAAESARRALREAFSRHGIAGDRLELRPPDGGFAEHLAAYLELDIVLDVFPYNGTTMTCEALWMGVPVVTLAGATHVSRVGASLLERVGLRDLVAATPAEYLDIALRLARDEPRRRELRGSLRERMRRSPLTDARRFTRDLESAYHRLWDEKMSQRVANGD